MSHQRPGDANALWAEMLGRWAIPDEIRAAVRESPYFFDTGVFSAAAEESLARQEDSRSDEAARQALPPGGSILDVGCGAGAASIRLCPARLVGVDSNTPLLDAFAGGAASRGIEVAVVEGRWPEAAERCATSDVVVCHHVFYNVPDLASFAKALDDHARCRVVVELTAVHPLAWMAPYWLALHGLAQPDRPTAEDALAVLSDLGLTVHQKRWTRRYHPLGEHTGRALESIARRLCLPPERLGELRRLLEVMPPSRDREVVTLWW